MLERESITFGVEWEKKEAPIVKWLPKYFKAYMNYVRESEPSPLHQLFTAMGIASIGIGGGSWINYGAMKPVSMNLYVGLIAPSGYRKSESLRLGMYIYNEALKRSDYLKDPVPDIASNVGLLKYAGDEGRMININREGKEYKYTPIFIPSSEFAAFIRTNDRDMVAMLTNLFDGAVISGVFSYKTITGGEFFINKPYPVLLVCTTPEWLTARLPQGARQGGFLNRFLFAYSEQFKRRAFPQSSPDIAKRAEVCIECLVRMAMMNATVNWSPEAKEVFTNWYEETGGGLDGVDDHELRSWLSRQGIFIIKLAGISALSDHRVHIQVKDLEFAWTILHYAKQSVKITFRLTGENIDAWLEVQLIKFVLKEGQQSNTSSPIIPASRICRRFSTDASATKIRQLLESLSSLGVINFDRQNDRVIGRLPQASNFVKESTSFSYELSWDELDGAL